MDSKPGIDALVDKAKRHVRKKDFDEATRLFKQALEIDERRIDVHEGLATTYFLAKDYEEAISHFKRMTHIDPRQGKALINLGAVYNRVGEFSKAVDVLRRGTQKVKNYAEAYYNLGLAYRGLKQSAMAVSAYREALRLDPEMAVAHQNLANVYVEMGNFQQAIIHYNKALEVDPNFEKAKRGLAAAKNAIQQARNSISPFGRLVDASQKAMKAATRFDRELTDTERMKDRQVIHTLSVDIETAATRWLDHLRAEFEPKMQALNRAVLQINDNPSAITRSADEFREAFEQNKELREVLKRKILELRAHEELMNTPNLQVPK